MDDDAPPPPTARLAPENAAYLRFGSSPDQEHQPTADGLKALLAISTAINAIRDEGALERELLGLLFDAVPAAEGAIVQPGVGNELIVQGFRPLSGDSPVHVNAALVRQVIGEGTGMVCADATRPRVSAAMPSHALPDALSVLAVPLTVQGRPLGAIYLDVPGPALSSLTITCSWRLCGGAGTPPSRSKTSAGSGRSNVRRTVCKLTCI